MTMGRMKDYNRKEGSQPRLPRVGRKMTMGRKEGRLSKKERKIIKGRKEVN